MTRPSPDALSFTCPGYDPEQGKTVLFPVSVHLSMIRRGAGEINSLYIYTIKDDDGRPEAVSALTSESDTPDRFTPVTAPTAGRLQDTGTWGGCYDPRTGEILFPGEAKEHYAAAHPPLRPATYRRVRLTQQERQIVALALAAREQPAAAEPR